RSLPRSTLFPYTTLFRSAGSVKIERTLMTRELSKRPYRMKKRAELQERTRRRITESAVELHGTLGPSRTSISAVAAHAGVRRSRSEEHTSELQSRRDLVC